MRWIYSPTAIAVVFTLVVGCGDETPPLIEPETPSPADEGWQFSDDEAEPESEPGFRVETAEFLPDTEARPGEILGCVDDDVQNDCDRELVVHEWGTFTSVQSSEGEYLEGLHHEEEALPGFVHRFEYRGVDAMAAPKGIHLPEPVTQKMETPVIYFYTDRPRTVDVTVEFPKGVFSEWYPEATDYHNPPPLAEVANGGMDWTVDLTHEQQSVPEVPEDDIWIPSRQVPDAAYVVHGAEREKFIFYRGLGNFEPPFAATHDGEKFEFGNLSGHQIPAAYLLKVDDQQEIGQIYELGSIGGFDSVDHMPAPKESPVPLDAMVEKAKDLVAGGLVDTGLTGDEAQAMVETWADSYFRTPGYRVLYIVPDAWTERLLPIHVDPEPDRMVRTLVGRVEVLTTDDEQRTVDGVKQAFEENETSFFVQSGAQRFSEPRLRRACQLIDEPAIAEWCRERVEEIQFDRQLSVMW